MVPRQCHQYLPNFTHILTAILLRCYARLGRRHFDVTGHLACPQRSYGDLTALVLSMFKTWRRPQRPWRPYCDLQRCYGALRDLTTTQRRSAAIGPILQIAARSPSCVTGVSVNIICYMSKLGDTMVQLYTYDVVINWLLLWVVGTGAMV